LPNIEQIYKEELYNLSPMLYKTLVDTAITTGVPSFGQSNFVDEIIEPFASNLFTSMNYASAKHKDDDVQDWVFGVFGNVHKTSGDIVTKQDGY